MRVCVCLSFGWHFVFRLPFITKYCTSSSSTLHPLQNPVGRTTTKKEQRSANNLYQELSFQDNEESEENEIVTGMWVKSPKFVNCFFFCFFFLCFYD